MKKKGKTTWELLGGKGKGAFTPQEILKTKKSTVKAKKIKPSK